MKTYKNCQSCGMPLSKDPQKGGTNTDGSRSTMYCSYCYEQGTFKQADWTVTQMQAFVKTKIKEMGWFMGLFAGPFVKNIPNLERWKSKK